MSSPRATEFGWIVVEILILARFVTVAVPTTSPESCTSKSATSKFNFAAVSSYVTEIPFSVFGATIMSPTMSWIRSSFRDTSPDETKKSTASKLATPLFDALASSAATVIV